MWFSNKNFDGLKRLNSDYWLDLIDRKNNTKCKNWYNWVNFNKYSEGHSMVIENPEIVAKWIK